MTGDDLDVPRVSEFQNTLKKLALLATFAIVSKLSSQLI